MHHVNLEMNTICSLTYEASPQLEGRLPDGRELFCSFHTSNT